MGVLNFVPRVAPAKGFTLLELLVVLVIAGITLGLVSFNAMPGQEQVLRRDAQRIALLLQTARDEAILRNSPIAFEADSERYRFLLRSDHTWQPILDDALLRERAFTQAPVDLSIEPPLPERGTALRLVFGREPVDKPFLLTLSAGENAVSIRADGVGHYVVE